MKTYRSASLLLVACIAGVVLSGCSHGVQDVQVAHAQARNISAQPGGLGTVAASVDVPVTLDFRDAVTAVHVVAGDRVTQGQALLDLDATGLALNAQSLALRLSNATAGLQRTQASLAGAGGKSADYIAGLQAQVQALQGQIGLDQQLVNIANGHSPTVVSPINGVVQAIAIKPGQTATPGQVLADIVDFTRISVTANLPVADQTDVTQGAPTTVTFPDFPNIALTGSVTTVSATAINSGTSFQVTIDAANTPDQKIRPGVNAYARVQVTHKAVIAVPKEAVLNVNLNPTVVVVSGQTVQRHQVQVGISDDKYAEILSGVQVNDVVVIVGNQTLDDGTPVHITKDEG
jgi:RND family efflux transporter MFP subunit